MTPAAFTPGPWKVVKPGHGHPTECLCVQVGENEMYTTLELLPADARLIAAAPALLAALQDALRVCEPARHWLRLAGHEGGGEGPCCCNQCGEQREILDVIGRMEAAVAAATAPP